MPYKLPPSINNVIFSLFLNFHCTLFRTAAGACMNPWLHYCNTIPSLNSVSPIGREILESAYIPIATNTV